VLQVGTGSAVVPEDSADSPSVVPDVGAGSVGTGSAVVPEDSADSPSVVPDVGAGSSVVLQVGTGSAVVPEDSSDSPSVVPDVGAGSPTRSSFTSNICPHYNIQHFYLDQHLLTNDDKKLPT